MRKKFALAFLTCAAVAFLSTAAFAQVSWSDVQTSTDEALLMKAIDQPGDSPEAIHNVNVACKRLAVYGTPKSIPALVALLSVEKQNFNARFALEAMPFDEVDAALAKAAQELSDACLVGVIDTIGVRGKVESVALLKSIGEKATDPAVKKAVYAALGAIATDDASAYLVAESKTDLSNADFIVKRGLGDAILDVAEARETAGQLDAAAELYDAANFAAAPKFVQEAGLYRSLLCRGASSADAVVATLNDADASKVDVALKTIREFDEASAPEIVKAILAAFDKFPEEKQVYIIRALGDVKDDASKQLVYPKAEELAKNGSNVLKVAAVKALLKNGYHGGAAFTAMTSDKANFDDPALSEAIVEFGANCEQTVFFFMWKGVAEKELASIIDSSENVALAYMKIAELRRTPEAAPTLVKVAETKTGALRDGALAALSEIVSLDDLNQLVDALNGETDDAKVDWILRAACTRLPREACAAKVADLFEKADLDAKNKMLPLLKQIGGATALAAVAKACNGSAVDKATQILGEWNTPEDANGVAEICLTIAKQSNDAKYHSRGIRGYVRVARQFDLPVATKIEMCKIAFETAKRADDKALIFEVFKRNIIADNVAAALEYAKYPEFQENAFEAAVFVAEKIRVSQPDWNWTAQTDDAAKAAAGKILVDGMNQVVASTKNADLKARAQKLL